MYVQDRGNAKKPHQLANWRIVAVWGTSGAMLWEIDTVKKRRCLGHNVCKRGVPRMKSPIVQTVRN